VKSFKTFVSESNSPSESIPVYAYGWYDRGQYKPTAFVYLWHTDQQSTFEDWINRLRSHRSTAGVAQRDQIKISDTLYLDRLRDWHTEAYALNMDELVVFMESQGLDASNYSTLNNSEEWFKQAYLKSKEKLRKQGVTGLGYNPDDAEGSSIL
jgi:hypothetical protein